MQHDTHGWQDQPDYQQQVLDEAAQIHDWISTCQEYGLDLDQLEAVLEAAETAPKLEVMLWRFAYSSAIEQATQDIPIMLRNQAA